MTEVGLKYVYAENVPEYEGENTYYPRCQELLIKRFGFTITSWNLKKAKTCPKYWKKIAISGQFCGALNNKVTI